MKLDQKRIKNDDFEQVVKCEECGKLFWATSEWELGNWERECKKCKIKIRIKGKEELENVKKNGEPIKNFQGDILGWRYKDDFFSNNEYYLNENVKTVINGREINVNNIDDYIREEKRKGKKIFYWDKNGFDLLTNFAFVNGYTNFKFIIDGKNFYMGVKHLLK